MKYRYDPSVRSFQQPLGGQGQGPQNLGNGPFPGISDPFMGMNKSIGINTPVPFDTAEFSSGVPSITIQPASMQQIIPLPESNSTSLTAAPAQAAEAKADAKDGKDGKGGFNLGNSLSDLKGVVDRMGGLDGIVTTMTKVQKVVGSITQMAPLIKVLAGSFGKKGASATIAEDDDSTPRPRPRKKKGRKPVAGKSIPLNGTKRKRPRPRR
ncbi:hypothetical protein GZH47_11890 [Paenibacillus rhizovicinus]|uniref:Tyrosine protein kinase n=1 Tax=Paenibacillus rhizovicinus TaxID=2704463 RepID=A0A6C0NZ05_9BACL|nr:hypothetical protein [Paenibacillus rhizovicinus]QHW31474.1 hypothetical protein GZH47_11890 [Paenibacillus rhizovicinus]